MEKKFKIVHAKFYGSRAHYTYVPVICEESKVKEIAVAVAKGSNPDFCYIENEDGERIATICDCM